MRLSGYNLSSIRQSIGNILSDTPLYGPLHSTYWNFIVPLMNRLRDFRAYRRREQVGIVNIDPRVKGLSSFHMYLNSSISDQRRRRMRGVYEKPVLEVLSTEIDESSVLWEIGAGHGWFSLAAAANDANSYAVEADQDNASAIRVGADANNVDINVFESFVGDTESLDRLINSSEPPTIAIIDVEGSELDVLRTASKMMSVHKPIIIVEVHHEKLSDRGHSVEDVQNILERSGYKVEELFRRRSTNGHLIARPEGGDE